MIYTTLELAVLAMVPEDNVGLLPQQQAQYQFHELQVEQYGQYSQGILANGSHYGAVSPFAAEGIVCANCVYYENNACHIVQGAIAPAGICKFWIIPETTLGE
jgi:hypothetical protein